MKKLDILIIKSFLGPLLLTFSISEFVLLLQFIWKILEKMIGKGLDTLVILQLFWYILVTLVPMALPLAILLASIMTLGNFGERYELVAMKSAGISLWRILRPMIAVVSLLSVFAFFFSNNFMPIAEKKMRTLMYEINTKKPTVNIRPNEFYADIEQYIIRIGAKDKDGKNLSDVVIYDHSTSLGNISITAAKKGTKAYIADYRGGSKPAIQYIFEDTNKGGWISVAEFKKYFTGCPAFIISSSSIFSTIAFL